MRSNGARTAMVVIVLVLTTGIAAGQQYRSAASMLRYPLPQSPVGYSPQQPAPPAYEPAMNYGAPYYAYGPSAGVSAAAAVPPGVYANQAYSPMYASRPVDTPPAYGGWPPAAPSYYGAPAANPPAYPVYAEATPPRYAVAPGERSLLVQSPPRAEPVPAQPYAEPSPSDAVYGQTPNDPYYNYRQPRQAMPAYPQTRTPQFTAPQSGPAYPAYGGWLADSPYQAGGVYGGYDACGGYPVCGPVCAPPVWFAGVYGLYMTHDNENHYRFSYDDAWESIQLTDSRDANPDLMGGVEVRAGRYFNCGLNAVEAVYWGLFPADGSTITRRTDVTGHLDGILNWHALNYNGRTAEWFVNDAVIHAIYRQSEFQNVEINLLQFCGAGCGDPCLSCNVGKGCGPYGCGSCGWADPCGPAFRYAWLAGIRWFMFRDDILFGADTVDAVFTGAPEEIFYGIDIQNHLIGFQLGGRGEYYLTRCLALNFGHKVGLFGNHIEHESRIGGSAGLAMINNGPNYGRYYHVNNSKNDVSLLGELQVGLTYRFASRWAVAAGYRLVGATGMALPTNQIYPDLRGINDVEEIDSNGHVLLYGGYVGLEYGF